MAGWISVGDGFIAADVIRWKEPVFNRGCQQDHDALHVVLSGDSTRRNVRRKPVHGGIQPVTL